MTEVVLEEPVKVQTLPWEDLRRGEVYRLDAKDVGGAFPCSFKQAYKSCRARMMWGEGGNRDEGYLGKKYDASE